MRKYKHWIAQASYLLTCYLAFVLSVYSQAGGRSATSPTIPAYNSLPTEEGYFAGADDAKLFYRVVGKKGETIVFVHGGPGMGMADGGYDLEAIAAKGFRFVEFDERGGGRSELFSDKAKLGIDDYVRDLEALRRRFKLKKMNLIGLSWGAAIVAHYAAEYPQNVNRIIFLSPMSPTEELWDQRVKHLRTLYEAKTLARRDEIAGLWQQADDKEIAGLCHEYYGYSGRLYLADPAHAERERGDICSYSPDSLRRRRFVGDAGFDSLGHWNFEPMLAKIHTPTLVIEGAKTNVPLDATQTWAKWLPNSRLLLIPDAGHQSWLDQPEAVFSAIGNFFRRRRDQITK